MTNTTEFYDAKISVRSQINYLSKIKGKLLQPFENRYSLFRKTVFGPWLDIPSPSNDNHLLNYVLQHQVHVPQKREDFPTIVYKIGDHELHFGRREFCLVTGFRCGQVSETFSSSQSPFCDRVFPDKRAKKTKNVKGQELLNVLENEKLWSELTDEDAVRVCLLLVAEAVFMGRELWLNLPRHILTLVEDFVAWDAFPWGEYMWSWFYKRNVNVVPNHADRHLKEENPKKLATYNLNGFVWALKIWILESCPNSSLWWVKQTSVIPRCLAWSNSRKFKKSDHDRLFLQAILDLDPTVEESEQAWWIDSLPFFRGEVRPIVQAVQGEVTAVEGFEEDHVNDDIPVMQYGEEQKENGEVIDLVKEEKTPNEMMDLYKSVETSSPPPNEMLVELCANMEEKDVEVVKMRKANRKKTSSNKLTPTTSTNKNDYTPSSPTTTNTFKPLTDEQKEALENVKQKFLELPEKKPVIEVLQDYVLYRKKVDAVIDAAMLARATLEVKDLSDRDRILSRGMPWNEKDLGNFVLPIKVNWTTRVSALAVTRSSVNVMPYPLFKKLGLSNPQPNHSKLTMADNSQAKAMGEVKNVTVQIGYQPYLADFLVLDIPVDKSLPLLLGRPFLRTCGAIIDMGNGMMTIDDGISKETYYSDTRGPTLEFIEELELMEADEEKEVYHTDTHHSSLQDLANACANACFFDMELIVPDFFMADDVLVPSEDAFAEEEKEVIYYDFAKEEKTPYQMIKSAEVNVVKVNDRPCLEKVVVRKQRSCMQRKRKASTALKSLDVQQPPTTPRVPKRRSRENNSKSIEFPLVSGAHGQHDPLEPFVEDLPIYFNCNRNKVTVPGCIKSLLKKGKTQSYRFPWGKSDIIVDYRFWLALLCLDEGKTGWLLDDHLQIWVDLMWHFRAPDADWSMVGPHFCPSILGGNMPSYYANTQWHPVAWSNVEKVYFPLNEPKKHWALAELQIRTGVITIYDSLAPQNEPRQETRDWWLVTRKTLAIQLRLYLNKHGVLKSKGIHVEEYKITFQFAENVPLQADVYGDCGIWVCIFLHRLSHNLPLVFGDPLQVALAYRERMSAYFWKNKAILDLDPTVEESEQAWWIDSLPIFRGEVRPIAQAVQGEVTAVEGFEDVIETTVTVHGDVIETTVGLTVLNENENDPR